MRQPLLEVRNVSQTFCRPLTFGDRVRKRLTGKEGHQPIRAVDNVSLTIGDGEVVGLVGESGCGKSTLGRIAAGFDRPAAGSVSYKGAALEVDRSQDRYRLQIQMVFQNPFASLNPRMRVGEIIGEAVRQHQIVSRPEHDAYVDEQLRRTGLDPVYKHRYPHQFSGGQRQRICIARALAVHPRILICDEPVAALDVSIQAHILNLFVDLKEQLGLSYLFISHDLAVVEHISDRVVIMYLGNVVEEGDTRRIFDRASHPYTQALLDDAPQLGRMASRRAPLRGELPSPLNPPSGCHFHPRCPKAMPVCAQIAPSLRNVGPSHKAACHLNDPNIKA